MITRFLRVLAVFGMLLSAGPVLAQQPPGAPIEGFEPVQSVPPSEQLPAAPLLITAYAFAWIAVFFYVWTVWRRLTRVESEMRALESRRGQGSSQR